MTMPETPLRPIESALLDYREALERRYRNPEGFAGRVTGFHDLDYVTNGLQPGHLILLASRPCEGKTSLGLQLARRVAQNGEQPVLLFQLMASEASTLQRMLVYESGIEAHRLVSGQLTPADWTRLEAAMAGLKILPLHLDVTFGLSVSEIRDRVARFKGSRGIGLILIDSLQDLAGPAPLDDWRVEGRATRELKLLARECEAPVLLLSSLSRAQESRSDKRPRLGDLPSAGAAEDADVVLLLHWDAYDDPDTSEPGRAEILVVQNRNGPACRFQLAYEPRSQRFENLGENRGQSKS